MSKETDGLSRLSLKPCCHTKKVIAKEIKAKKILVLENPKDSNLSTNTKKELLVTQDEV